MNNFPTSLSIISDAWLLKKDFCFDLHVTITLSRSHRTNYTDICSIQTNESQAKNWPNQLGNSIQKNLWREMLQITIPTPYTWTPFAKNSCSSFGVGCKKHFAHTHSISHLTKCHIQNHCFIVNTIK
jgi:hypothetical protein